MANIRSDQNKNKVLNKKNIEKCLEFDFIYL